MVWVIDIMQLPESTFFDLLITIVTLGLPATASITIFALLIGFLIGVSLALIRSYAFPEWGMLATGYERIFRSVPVLVLMFVFMVSTNWGGMLSAIVALGVVSGAYQSQIFRGAIMAVDQNQILAALALGMNRLQVAVFIVLPQAFRIALPAWANEYAVVIKDTGFVGALGVIDLLRAADYVRAVSPALYFTTVLILTIIYFILTYPVTRGIAEFQTRRLRQMGLGAVMVN